MNPLAIGAIEVSPLALGLIGLAVVFILMFLRVPIAFAFFVVGFIGVWLIRGSEPAFEAIRTIPYATVSKYIYTVVPLFVLMGYLALQTKLAAEFYEGVRRWVGHFRGGLAAAVILGNTAFGACTGDPISASVTFTSYPWRKEYGGLHDTSDCCVTCWGPLHVSQGLTSLFEHRLCTRV